MKLLNTLVRKFGNDQINKGEKVQINDPIVKGELQMNVSNFIYTPNSKFHNFKFKNFLI